MTNIRVLVQGASIAGPALAYWLRRYGAEVTVVEQAPGLRQGGQAVDARGVAREVVRRMGLEAQVQAARTRTAGVQQVDATGNVVHTERAEDQGGDGYVAEIEILRGDLARVLHEATRDDVEHLFGDRVAALAQDADGVDVTFAGGAQRRFDLVVGADGVHSSLRRMAFGPHESIVRHLGLVVAWFSLPNAFGLDRWLVEHAEGGRCAGLRPVQDTERAIATLWFPAPAQALDHRDAAGQKDLLRAGMAGFGWRTDEILGHVDDAGDFYLDECAQVVLDRWSRGRVGLIGDAAYSASPMSGAGTGLALVGAFLLAGELAGAGWDPEAGFAGYQRRMQDYVDANQEIGRMHVEHVLGPGPGEAAPEPDMEALMPLIERAVTGPALPDYASPETSRAR
ncbi:FAD-dependent monooxygenase [Microlunatus flavus]|uniref:2-polyprenyl-6-methoxyphenol hydroxylase n=1 Tax=Microlunatus flavus TaxID=1036181 RepID=A0A1H8Z334_9ACTN|nr:FAD-dependent monooxygenase [Microlunatus flavus]SEP58677.1 2-polyprenyl-6-methoxyphenol hydroxylase [Microlunatus flavus]